jgi:hypothetical protein
MRAIDACRRIGNIAAHMDKDANVVFDVTRDEAQLLVELVRLLAESWYVARARRQLVLEELQMLAEGKYSGNPKLEPTDAGEGA